MFSALKRLIVLSVLVVLIVLFGCAWGFIVGTQLRGSPPAEAQKEYLRQPGDAPPQVRSKVVLALNGFQEGYTKRDVSDLSAFMDRLFAKDEDVLILGTDNGEWVQGYTNAMQLIKGDWQNWGDVRLVTESSAVWSSGDTAWIATIGEVRFKNTDRPIRMTAVLVRRGDRWLFRELHFQWDDTPPRFRDLFRPQAGYLLISWVHQHLTRHKPWSKGR